MHHVPERLQQQPPQTLVLARRFCTHHTRSFKHIPEKSSCLGDSCSLTNQLVIHPPLSLPSSLDASIHL